jgi:hypothetical protein
MMPKRLNAQGGYAVPTAMILMSIMLTIGFAVVAFSDAETNSSNRERIHESRLNLTEGVIAAEIFQMSRSWPTTAEQQYPDVCTADSTQPLCPTPAQLKAQFSGPDFDPANTYWNVKVRDDVAGATGQFYDDATVLGRPTYDENANGEMWVRAEGQINRKIGTTEKEVKRVVVARVRVEKRPLSPPKAPFVAGKFNTGNNAGNKVIVETTPGVYGVVRCDNGTDVTSHSSDCVDYGNGQMTPTNMVKSDLNAGNAIPAGLVDSLKQMAIKNNTYYPTGCPSDPTGAVVWVENGNCSYNGNMIVNGTTKQGIFIINNGTLALSGSVTWWGVIYALNSQECGVTNSNCLTYKGYSDNVVTITGTPTVHGAIFVDGEGRLGIGNSGNSGNCANCLPNLMYDPSVVMNLTAFGTAGIIQNTWREIPPAETTAVATPAG